MPRPVPSIEESKRAASLLMKDLRSANSEISRAAAKRFRRIEPFKSGIADDLLSDRDVVQYKHALDVVAREQGYGAWKNLKDAADVLWNPPRSAAYWHNWCKTHAEARSYLEQRGGYLLSAHGKCFVAERGYIEFLGLDPDDSDWAAIGYDVVEPKDAAASDRLIEQRRVAQNAMGAV